MTIRPLTRAEMRALDTQAAETLGLPVLVLMENAGRGAAELLRAGRRGGRGSSSSAGRAITAATAASSPDTSTPGAFPSRFSGLPRWRS